MNEHDVVQNMIAFITDKEQQLQIEKISTGQTKTDIVKLILEELERETNNEDQ